MIKWLKSRGYTDRLYVLNLLLAWTFIVVCVILTCAVDAHTDIVTVGIPAVFAELGVHTGYIVWKAKNENINKHLTSEPTTQLDDCIGFMAEEVEEE